MVSSTVKSHFGVNFIEFYGRRSNARAAAKYRLRKHSFMRCFTHPVTSHYAVYNTVVTIISICHRWWLKHMNGYISKRSNRRAFAKKIIKGMSKEKAVNAAKFSENGERTPFLSYYRAGPESPVAERGKRYPLKQIMSPGFIFTTGQIPALVSTSRTKRSRRRRGTDTGFHLIRWRCFESRHRKIYIALFIENNASENNHRRVSNDRGGKGRWNRWIKLFVQASQRMHHSVRRWNWFNARFHVYRKPRLIT